MRYIPKISVLLTAAALVLCACGGNEAETAKNSTQDGKENVAVIEAASSKKVIVIFGNSLTAGFGVDPAEAYPGLLQARLDSLGLAYEVINAGVSGETTATGNSRVNWVISQQPVDIFVLELGGNDGLRGIPVAETRKNLEEMIDKVRAAHPDAEIVLAGMMVPPNMGQPYSRDFQQVYPDVAKNKNTKLIPFLLENVGGVDTLNLADGIHPTPAGHKLVVENVWEVLAPLVRE